MTATQKKQRDMDLGLAVSGATLEPGQRRSAKMLARYCGCTHQAIEAIEKKALRKIRWALADDLKDIISAHDIPQALSSKH